ncbi:non-ribosomal peptide synthetase, partial [Actinoalloteichus spitiensis]|uniref:non-ribosomal peptide synthetase n=1 Tax=Actinoalloteichus spitiensis TaxID=252394 RepID=UPI00035E6D54
MVHATTPLPSRTAAPAPDTRTVLDWYDHHVAAAPDAPALEARGRVLSYRELDTLATRLAHALRGQGIGPERLVGVCTRRGVEMAVTMLAVAKAGAGYLPLDPDHPADRLRFVLTDAGPDLVLHQPETEGLVRSATGAPTAPLDLEALPEVPAAPVVPGAGPDSLLYVIYTSGSTGRPKGIVMGHLPQVNLMEWSRARYRHGSRVLHYFPITSDVGCYELWATWSTGGHVVVADDEQRFDIAEVAGLIHRHRIERVLLPVVALDQLARHTRTAPELVASLREVITTGDRQVVTPAVRELFAGLPEAVLDNHYGSTEVNVVTCPRSTSAQVVTGPEVSSVSTPVSRSRIYVLDRDLNLAPVGVVGVIHVGGPPLARGYLGRPDLTARTFVADPHSPRPGARMYRTGDLGRWRADGTLEFLGRADFQIKLHGYRVEPGEIESLVRERGDVDEAVVVARDLDTDDPSLALYLVAAPGGAQPEATPDALRSYLRQRLPSHMVPRHVIVLPELPLSANGKVDRRRLPAPEEVAVPAAAAPPDDVERTVIEVWRAVLGRDEIAPGDDFFALGGHSLLLAQVVHRLRQALDVDLPLRALFDFPTVRELAVRVRQARETAVDDTPRIELRPRDPGEPAPLSHAQERMWFLGRMFPDSAMYNNMLALRLRGPLDLDRLRSALSTSLARHEALRTVFPDEAGVPHQSVLAPWPVELPVVDVGTADADRVGAARRIVGAEQLRPFDLATGPLVRHTLIRLGERDHVLCVVLHHIISDGTSLGVLRRELAEYYQAGTGTRPAPLPVQYGDFAVWQRRSTASPAMAEHLAYWREQLRDAPPVLELVSDRPRHPDHDLREGPDGEFELVVDAELTSALEELGRRAHATLFMTTLTAFGAVLSQRSADRREDVVVGVPFDRRPDPRLADLVGLFINPVPLRWTSSRTASFLDVLSRVRKVSVEGQAHQDLPFERLVEELATGGDLTHHPVFQVMFQLQHEDDRAGLIPGVEIDGFSGVAPPSKFDLSLSIVKTNGGLSCGFGYSAALFDESTAHGIAEDFLHLLRAATAEPDRPLAELLVSADDVRREWCASAPVPAPWRPVPDLVAEHARLRPEDVAVVCEDAATTYAGLEERVRVLTRMLRGAGVGDERVVAVALPRSPDLVAALLAVFRAGGVAMPLDLRAPAERLALLLSDVEPEVVLTSADPRWSVPRVPGSVTLVVDGAPAGDDSAASDEDGVPPAHLTEQSAAYLLHTSGSTGHPKAVLGLHGGLTNRLAWFHSAHPWSQDDPVCAKSSVGFLDGLTELFGPLAHGGRVVLATDDEAEDVTALIDLVRRHTARRITVVPSLLSALVEHPDRAGLSCCQLWVSSGEPLRPELVRRFTEVLPRARLLDLYGMSEASGDSMAAQVVPAGPSVGGHPIWHTGVHVLDERLRPVPEGCVGEVFVSGAGLARGYRGSPGLTAARFLPAPFGPPGSRLYRTGDLGVRRADGSVTLAGRGDDQLKVRGWRVEPAEVEAQLVRHPDVRAAAVGLRDLGASGGPVLVAWIVADRPPADHDLVALLRERLPRPLVPSYFEVVEELPTTSSGKLDRRRLPTPRPGNGRRP